MNRPCFAGCLAVMLVPASHAAELPAADVLKKTSEVYRNLQAYEFVVTRTYAVMTRGDVRSGESHIALAAVKPGKCRLTVKDATKEIILVTDGETTWTYAPKLKSYTKQQVAIADEQDAPEGQGADADLLTDAQRSLVLSYQTLDKYAAIATRLKDDRIKAGREKAECYVIQIVLPKGPHQFWIDKRTFLVLRHKETYHARLDGAPAEFATTTNCQEAEIEFTPEGGLFAFEPPSDAREVPTLNLPGERPMLTGKMAADFTLKDVDGNQIRLNELRGNIVLLDFWATWCQPCRKELPSIDKLNRQFKDKGVIVLGINSEQPGVVKGFLKKNEYSLTTLMDSKSAVHRMYGARSIPTVIVIDRAGLIKAHFIGGRSEQDLLSALRTAGLEN